MRKIDNSQQYFSYFQAVFREGNLSQGIPENPFTDDIEQNFCFHYGSASYSTYVQENPAPCISKFMAIPYALYSGVVKTIYHLAKAIFLGIPRLFVGDTSCLQVNISALVRDLEEAVGYLVSLFDDKVGSYLVEESLFQKECYAVFARSAYVNHLNAQEDMTISFTDSNVEDDLYVNMTLNNLEELDTNEIEDIRVWLQKRRESKRNRGSCGNKGELSILAFSKMTGQEIVANIKKIPSRAFLLLSKEQIQRMDLSNVDVDSLSWFLSYLPGKTWQDRLNNLSTKQLNPILNKMEGHFLYSLAKEKFSEIAIQQLTVGQIKSLLYRKETWCPEKEAADRISSLSLSQLQFVLERIEDNDPILHYIHENRFGEIDIRALTPRKLQTLLVGCVMHNYRTTKASDRIRSVPKNQLQSVFNKLPENLKQIAREIDPSL